MRDILLFPWEDWEGAVGKVKAQILKDVPTNFIHLDFETRKYDEYKGEEVFPNKREQSLEYMLHHWPKGNNRRVVIQAGGSLGFWPRVLGSFFDTIYTFEAQAESFYFLSLNCVDRNIIKFQAALGEAPGTFIDIPQTTKPGKGKVGHGGVIPVITIDQFNLNNVDLICLDIEGYEPQALRGALRTIKRCRPYVLCEDNWNSDEIEHVLRNADYEVVTKANKDRIFKPKEKPWSGGKWDKHTKGLMEKGAEKWNK